jgi:flagellar biosynthesis protein
MRKSPDETNALARRDTPTPAEDILRLAREHDVPLRPDPALAGALASLDIGMTLPPELFRAVAEVLAFVCKMNGKA